MNISDQDVLKYEELHEKNKQLIIKKNVLNNLLLHGRQSEAIRMVLNKVASGGLIVEGEQKDFVTMLKNNNYDINKIIDDYVKKLNTKIVEQKAEQAPPEPSGQASEQDTTDSGQASEEGVTPGQKKSQSTEFN